ncbi:MAG TPA: hypothetical protein VFH63_01485 [candidate division Zixibacteria bacterium]|nr:hypothetical protein [candidate division Zixibacteria bacterium]
MRVSLTARYVSHPTIHFDRGRAASRSPRLGLRGASVVYHRPRAARTALPTVSALRSQTSRFAFPSVPPALRVRERRSAHPLGLPRARRA